MRSAFFFPAFICALTVLPVHGEERLDGTSDALPIPNGAYLRAGENRCQMLKAGELDMIDFNTENDGRSFSYPEVGCVVSSVKKLSSSRYAVKGDCREFGELSQTDFFLDVLSKGRIRIEGEEFTACDWKPDEEAAPTPSPTVSQGAPIPTKPNLLKAGIPLPVRDIFAEDEPTKPTAIRKLINQWADEEEGCRGGSGDDPETYEACGRRERVVAKLRKAGWCYGEENQSLSAQEWDECKSKK